MFNSLDVQLANSLTVKSDSQTDAGNNANVEMAPANTVRAATVVPLSPPGSELP